MAPINADRRPDWVSPSRRERAAAMSDQSPSSLKRSELAPNLLAGRELQNEIRTGARLGEFWLAYQPILDMHGEVWGAEALMRWAHPMGAQSPALFVPAMEQCELIHQLGAWTLTEACKQAHAWRKTRPDFRLNVNVSPVQLRDAAFIDRVMDALHVSGLLPGALSLEITENVLIGHDGHVIERLHHLASLGIGLYMDDFGTGFSSIGNLRHLPFTGIKIDRSFVHNLSQDPRGQAVMRWVVGLGRELGLDLIAEGVETHEDARIVVARGVAKLQGFLYSEGLSAVDFERQF
jgi:EAL domain-containing protein (putative c-di-GMP-specific phosphodiesterase class I)